MNKNRGRKSRDTASLNIEQLIAVGLQNMLGIVTDCLNNILSTNSDFESTICSLQKNKNINSLSNDHNDLSHL